VRRRRQWRGVGFVTDAVPALSCVCVRVTCAPGGRRNNKGRGSFCVLDCIYNQDTLTYYIVDMLVWKVRVCALSAHHRGQDVEARVRVCACVCACVCVLRCLQGMALVDSEAEMRQWWVRTKLEEERCLTVPISSSNQYRFAVSGIFSGPVHAASVTYHAVPLSCFSSRSTQPLPFFECDLKGLQEAYEKDFSFHKVLQVWCRRCARAFHPSPMHATHYQDGLLFMMKEWRYEEGVSPAVLVWKDAGTSRWQPNLTPAAGVAAKLPVTLVARDDGSLRTREEVSRPRCALVSWFSHSFFLDGFAFRCGISVGCVGAPCTVVGRECGWYGAWPVHCWSCP